MQIEISTILDFGNDDTNYDYRVVADEDGIYSIREVFYKDSEVVYFSEDPVSPYGEDPDDLADDIDLMIAALEKPVLQIVDGELVPLDDEDDEDAGEGEEDEDDLA
jgi:hypothetical protein